MNIALDLWSDYFINKVYELSDGNISAACISMLSKNQNITWNTIVNYSDIINWDFNYVSVNPNVTWEIIQSHPQYAWNYKLMSENPNITLDIMEQHPEYNWNIRNFCKNPNITLEFLQKYNRSHKLSWFDISKNDSMTFDLIAEYSEFPWSRLGLCMNPNVSMSLANEHDLFEVSTLALSSNEGILPHDIEFTRDKYLWNSSAIQLNRNITWENVLDFVTNFDDFLMNNENTTFDLIERYLDRSSYALTYSICKNNFTLERNTFLSSFEDHSKYHNDLFRDLTEVVFSPKNIARVGLENIDDL